MAVSRRARGGRVPGLSEARIDIVLSDGRIDNEVEQLACGEGMHAVRPTHMTRDDEVKGREEAGECLRQEAG